MATKSSPVLVFFFIAVLVALIGALVLLNQARLDNGNLSRNLAASGQENGELRSRAQALGSRCGVSEVSFRIPRVASPA